MRCGGLARLLPWSAPQPPSHPGCDLQMVGPTMLYTPHTPRAPQRIIRVDYEPVPGVSAECQDLLAGMLVAGNTPGECCLLLYSFP